MSIVSSTEMGNCKTLVVVDHDPLADNTDVKAGSFILNSNNELFCKLSDGDNNNAERMITKNSYDKTSDPGISNDLTEKYCVGSVWVNKDAEVATNRIWVCVDNAEGAASWKKYSYQ